MKILKAGDPCPCCGRPIPEGLPGPDMMLLSYIAEGMTLRDAMHIAGDVACVPVDQIRCSESELETLKALDQRDYRYLARNEDGRLFAFAELPQLQRDTPRGAAWVSRGAVSRLRVFADRAFSVINYETPLHIRTALQAAYRE